MWWGDALWHGAGGERRGKAPSNITSEAVGVEAGLHAFPRLQLLEVKVEARQMPMMATALLKAALLKAQANELPEVKSQTNELPGVKSLVVAGTPPQTVMII